VNEVLVHSTPRPKSTGHRNRSIVILLISMLAIEKRFQVSLPCIFLDKVQINYNFFLKEL